MKRPPLFHRYEDWEFLLSVFERQLPRHVPILGPHIHEVPDADSGRHGASEAANDFNAVLDYLYTYRRRPEPHPEQKEKRAALLAFLAGLNIPANML